MNVVIDDRQIQITPQRFLAQMLFDPITPQQERCCVGAVHTSVPGWQRKPAQWEVRCYQDYDALLAAQARGEDLEQINQRLWDEACSEQDRVGLVVHKRLPLCSPCVYGLLKKQVGLSSMRLTLLLALAGQSAFLLVANRTTEQSAVIANIAPGTPDENIVRRLQNEPLTSIRLKE